MPWRPTRLRRWSDEYWRHDRSAAQLQPRRSIIQSYLFQQMFGLLAICAVLIIACLVSLFPTLYVVMHRLKGGGNSLYSPTPIPQQLRWITTPSC